jgi:hypothetical protein
MSLSADTNINTLDSTAALTDYLAFQKVSFDQGSGAGWAREA